MAEPQPKPTRTQTAVSVLIFLSFIGFLTHACSEDSQKAEENRETMWIHRSQEGLKRQLKDPDSTQFQNVFFTRFEGHPMVCGEVNSRNGLGGYTGFQRFVASGDNYAFLEENVKGFKKVWKSMCSEKPTIPSKPL